MTRTSVAGLVLGPGAVHSGWRGNDDLDRSPGRAGCRIDHLVRRPVHHNAVPPEQDPIGPHTHRP